jgi:hypothetical protein
MSDNEPGIIIPIDYFDARNRFHRLASRHTELESLPLAAPGPAGEALTLDAAYFGADRPNRLILLTSGVHGVEGYAGSAMQLMWLANPSPLPTGVGVLLVHALNPWGYAHGRRANEDNVDLNRNGVERFPGPANPAYARIENWLNPRFSQATIGSWDGYWAGLLGAWVKTGYQGLKQAIAGGQYEYPEGLFYGGDRRQQSLRLLAELLARKRYAAIKKLCHLDIHTGLGRRGEWQLYAEANHNGGGPQYWQKGFGHRKVTVEGGGGSYLPAGTLLHFVRSLLPTAHATGAVLEFGTCPPVQILRALRAENAWHRYDPVSNSAQAAKRTLRECFWPSDATWRQRFTSQAHAILTKLRSQIA